MAKPNPYNKPRIIDVDPVQPTTPYPGYKPPEGVSNWQGQLQQEAATPTSGGYYQARWKYEQDGEVMYTPMNPNLAFDISFPQNPNKMQYTPANSKVYWANPQRVARFKTLIDNMPEGETAPDWLDVDGVNTLYNYLQFKNPHKAVEDWEELTEDDPAFYLAYDMTSPPSDMLSPYERDPIGVANAQMTAFKNKWKNYDHEAAVNDLLKANGYLTQEEAEAQLLEQQQGDWNSLEPFMKANLAVNSLVPNMPGVEQSYKTISDASKIAKTARSAFGMTGMVVGGVNLVSTFATGAASGIIGGPLGLAISGGVALAAGLATYIALKNGDEMTANKILQVFNIPAELTEQAIGTVQIQQQLAALGADMSKIDVGDMFKAAKSTYESGLYGIGNAEGNIWSVVANKLNPEWSSGMTAKANEVWQFQKGIAEPQAIREGYLAGNPLVESTLRIANGSDPDEVYWDMVDRYGYSGNRADFYAQAWIDPMQFVPYLTTLGLEGLGTALNKPYLAEAARMTRAEGNLAIDILPGYIQTPMQMVINQYRRWNIGAGRAAGADWWAPTGGIFDIYNTWQGLASYQTYIPGFDPAAGPPKLGKFEARLLGIDSETNTVKGVAYIDEDTLKFVKAAAGDLRTEEARAIGTVSNLYDAMSVMRVKAGNDPVEFMDYLSKVMKGAELVKEDPSNTANWVYDSPIVRAVRPVLKMAMDNDGVKTRLMQWEATRAQRNTLTDLTHIMQLPEMQIIERMKSGDYESFIMAARTSDVLNETAMRIQSGEWNAEKLRTHFKRVIDDGIEVLPEMMTVRLQEQISQTVFDKINKAYSLDEKKDFVNRFFHLSKSTQSLLYLGLNPAFLLSNAINNIATLSLDNLGSLWSKKDTAAILQKYQYYKPEATNSTEAMFGLAAMKSIRTLDGKDLKTKKDVLDYMQGVADYASKAAVFAQLSGMAEDLHRSAGLANAIVKQFGGIYPQLLPGMEEGLANTLRSHGFDPDTVDSYVKQVTNINELNAGPDDSGIARIGIDIALKQTVKDFGLDETVTKGWWDELDITKKITDKVINDGLPLGIAADQVFQELQQEVIRNKFLSPILAAENANATISASGMAGVIYLLDNNLRGYYEEITKQAQEQVSFTGEARRIRKDNPGQRGRDLANDYFNIKYDTWLDDKRLAHETNMAVVMEIIRALKPDDPTQSTISDLLLRKMDLEETYRNETFANNAKYFMSAGDDEKVDYEPIQEKNRALGEKYAAEVNDIDNQVDQLIALMYKDNDQLSKLLNDRANRNKKMREDIAASDKKYFEQISNAKSDKKRSKLETDRIKAAAAIRAKYHSDAAEGAERLIPAFKMYQPGETPENAGLSREEKANADTRGYNWQEVPKETTTNTGPFTYDQRVEAYALARDQEGNLITRDDVPTRAKDYVGTNRRVLADIADLEYKVKGNWINNNSDELTQYRTTWQTQYGLDNDQARATMALFTTKAEDYSFRTGDIDPMNYIRRYVFQEGTRAEFEADAALAGQSRPGPSRMEFMADSGKWIIKAIKGEANFTSLVHELIHTWVFDLDESDTGQVAKFMGYGSNEDLMQAHRAFLTGRMDNDNFMTNKQFKDYEQRVEKFVRVAEDYLINRDDLFHRNVGFDSVPFGKQKLAMQNLLKNFQGYFVDFVRKLKGSDNDLFSNRPTEVYSTGLERALNRMFTGYRKDQVWDLNEEYLQRVPISATQLGDVFGMSSPDNIGYKMYPVSEENLKAHRANREALDIRYAEKSLKASLGDSPVKMPESPSQAMPDQYLGNKLIVGEPLYDNGIDNALAVRDLVTAISKPKPEVYDELNSYFIKFSNEEIDALLLKEEVTIEGQGKNKVQHTDTKQYKIKAATRRMLNEGVKADTLRQMVRDGDLLHLSRGFQDLFNRKRYDSWVSEENYNYKQPTDLTAQMREQVDNIIYWNSYRNTPLNGLTDDKLAQLRYKYINSQTDPDMKMLYTTYFDEFEGTSRAITAAVKAYDDIVMKPTPKLASSSEQLFPDDGISITLDKAQVEAYSVVKRLLGQHNYSINVKNKAVYPEIVLPDYMNDILGLVKLTDDEKPKPVQQTVTQQFKQQTKRQPRPKDMYDDFDGKRLLSIPYVGAKYLTDTVIETPFDLLSADNLAAVKKLTNKKLPAVPAVTDWGEQERLSFDVSTQLWKSGDDFVDLSSRSDYDLALVKAALNLWETDSIEAKDLFGKEQQIKTLNPYHNPANKANWPEPYQKTIADIILSKRTETIVGEGENAKTVYSYGGDAALDIVYGDILDGKYNPKNSQHVAAMKGLLNEAVNMPGDNPIKYRASEAYDIEARLLNIYQEFVAPLEIAEAINYQGIPLSQAYKKAIDVTQQKRRTDILERYKTVLQDESRLIADDGDWRKGITKAQAKRLTDQIDLLLRLQNKQLEALYEAMQHPVIVSLEKDGSNVFEPLDYNRGYNEEIEDYDMQQAAASKERDTWTTAINEYDIAESPERVDLQPRVTIAQSVIDDDSFKRKTQKLAADFGDRADKYAALTPQQQQKRDMGSVKLGDQFSTDFVDASGGLFTPEITRRFISDMQDIFGYERKHATHSYVESEPAYAYKISREQKYVIDSLDEDTLEQLIQNNGSLNTKDYTISNYGLDTTPEYQSKIREWLLADDDSLPKPDIKYDGASFEQLEGYAQDRLYILKRRPVNIAEAADTEALLGAMPSGLTLKNLPTDEEWQRMNSLLNYDVFEAGGALKHDSNGKLIYPKKLSDFKDQEIGQQYFREKALVDAYNPDPKAPRTAKLDKAEKNIMLAIAVEYEGWRMEYGSYPDTTNDVFYTRLQRAVFPTYYNENAAVNKWSQSINYRSDLMLLVEPTNKNYKYYGDIAEYLLGQDMSNAEIAAYDVTQKFLPTAQTNPITIRDYTIEAPVADDYDFQTFMMNIAKMSYDHHTKSSSDIDYGQTDIIGEVLQLSRLYKGRKEYDSDTVSFTNKLIGYLSSKEGREMTDLFEDAYSQYRNAVDSLTEYTDDDHRMVELASQFLPESALNESQDKLFDNVIQAKVDKWKEDLTPDFISTRSQTLGEEPTRALYQPGEINKRPPIVGTGEWDGWNNRHEITYDDIVKYVNTYKIEVPAETPTEPIPPKVLTPAQAKRIDDLSPNALAILIANEGELTPGSSVYDYQGYGIFDYGATPVEDNSLFGALKKQKYEGATPTEIEAYAKQRLEYYQAQDKYKEAFFKLDELNNPVKQELPIEQPDYFRLPEMDAAVATQELATPARKITAAAKKLLDGTRFVDHNIEGTGKDGTITVDDVKNYIKIQDEISYDSKRLNSEEHMELLDRLNASAAEEATTAPTTQPTAPAVPAMPAETPKVESKYESKWLGWFTKGAARDTEERALISAALTDIKKRMDRARAKKESYTVHDALTDMFPSARTADIDNEQLVSMKKFTNIIWRALHLNEGETPTMLTPTMPAQEVPVPTQPAKTTKPITPAIKSLDPDNQPKPTKKPVFREPKGKTSLTAYQPPLDIAEILYEQLPNIHRVINNVADIAESPDYKQGWQSYVKDFSPEELQLWNNYMDKNREAMTNATAISHRLAEKDIELSMLDYNKRSKVDNWLDAAFPYQFWFTRSSINWAKRALNRPGILSQYSNRIKHMEQMGKMMRSVPVRNQEKMPVPWAFSEDWMGDTLYINPFNQLMPVNQILRPLEQLTDQMTGRDVNGLRTMLMSEEITQEEYDAAIDDQNNPLWERAREIEQLERKANTNPYELASMVLTPNMWGQEIYYRTTKQSGNNMPNTNAGIALRSTAGDAKRAGYDGVAGALEFAAGAMELPEKLLRGERFVYYGEWGNYLVDRELASMAAEGADITATRKAMIERKGDLWQEANRRVQKQIELKQPGGLLRQTVAAGDYTSIPFATVLTLFPTTIYPEGELIQRGLKDELQAAWDRANETGDTSGVSAWHTAHPEYMVRSGINDDPDTRLKKFLVNQIVDWYYSVDSPNLQTVKDHVGPDFLDALIVGKGEKIDYKSLSLEELTRWARLTNREIPKTADTEGITTQKRGEGLPQLYEGEDLKILNDYIAQRDELYPDRVWQSDQYHALESSTDKKIYLSKYPELKQYWEWNKIYKEKFPIVKEWQDKYSDPDTLQNDPYFGVSEEIVNSYRREKERLFPNATWLNAEYFAIDEDDKNKRRAFVSQYPELSQYWDWKKQVENENAEIKYYNAMMDAQYQRQSIKPVKPKDMSPNNIANALLELGIDKFASQDLIAYYSLGKPIPWGTMVYMKSLWEQAGSPGTLQKFIDDLF